MSWTRENKTNSLSKKRTRNKFQTRLLRYARSGQLADETEKQRGKREGGGEKALGRRVLATPPSPSHFYIEKEEKKMQHTHTYLFWNEEPMGTSSQPME